jgi:hypothetical protein
MRINTIKFYAHEKWYGKVKTLECFLPLSHPQAVYPQYIPLYLISNISCLRVRYKNNENRAREKETDNNFEFIKKIITKSSMLLFFRFFFLQPKYYSVNDFKNSIDVSYNSKLITEYFCRGYYRVYWFRKEGNNLRERLRNFHLSYVYSVYAQCVELLIVTVDDKYELNYSNVLERMHHSR